MVYHTVLKDMATEGDVTLLLRQWRSGNHEAEERLFELVLPDLRRLARRQMAGERPDHTIQPTELVNQIYLRLTNGRDRDWQDRGHFFAIAARAMRRWLIDYARSAPKARRVDINEAGEGFFIAHPNFEQAIQIDSLLNQLEVEQPEWCKVVELKFYLGLTDEEASEITGLSVRTLQRHWGDARRWLFSKLEGGQNPPHS
jgi:RNA polymerase sigma factor (TIGR02999 family)